MNNILILKNVSKKYGKKIILENINLSIAKGEVLGVVGVNGSGKSTLLKIIAGISSMSSGQRCLVNQKSNIKITYVPDRFPKLPLRPYEYLYHMGRIEGLSESYLNNRIEELFAAFNISNEVKNNLIKNCSKGTIQKFAIIQAILSIPDLIILDEPFSGLDKDSQVSLLKVLKSLKISETSIVITSHEKGYLSKIATQLFILENKQLLPVNNSMDKHPMIISFKANNNIDIALISKMKGVNEITYSNFNYILNADCEYSDSILYNILCLGASINSVGIEKI